MVHRALVVASFVACTLIVLSFGLFARDQLAGASKTQVSQLAGTATPATAPSARHRPGQPRRFIDGAAHALISPFQSAVPSDSDWVRQGIPTVLGLLVYGLCLGYVARYARGLA